MERRGAPPTATTPSPRTWGWPRWPTAPPSTPPSPTSPPSTPTTAWCWSTPAAVLRGTPIHERAPRAGSAAPLHTAVYTHGHIDHVFGVGRVRGGGRGQRVGPRRASSPTSRSRPLRPYILTAGYNGVINQRSSRSPACSGRRTTAIPTRPTATTSTIDGRRRDASSSTTPRARPTTTPGCGPGRKVLCTGDLFIWATPNCGNPQKVQRYPREWADRAPQDGRAGARGAAARPRPPDRRRRPRPPGPHRHARSCSSPWSTRRWR